MVSASLILPAVSIARLPIFCKEKIHPHTESPERVLLRSGLSVWRGAWGVTHGILQSGLPPVGGIPAMPRTFLRNVWGRGTAAAPKGRRWWKDSLRGTNPPPAHTDRKHYPRLRRDLVRRREVSRTHKGAFFFTKKAPCVNQTLCVAERGKSLQT